MRTVNRLLYIVALGLLAVATTSFGEGYFDPYGMNHGGFAPRFQNPYQRPIAPYGGVGGGTIANGGGMGMDGMGMTGFNPYQTMPYQNPYQSMYAMNNMMFNPYMQPYLNNAQWGMYNPYQSSNWNTPWTSNWGNGFGNTMMNPYWGSSFQQPWNNYSSWGQPNSWMYNNGIPGLGYNVGGLGANNFYDWGMNGYGNNGFSPYLGNNGFNYDPYGMGLGYGSTYSPYDYSGGFGGGYGGGGWDLGLNSGYYGNGWDVGFGGGYGW